MVAPRRRRGGGRLRLGLLAACPMHYQAPLYRRLAAEPSIDFSAVFASSAGVRPHDAGYGHDITWDADLLGGYESQFLSRADSNPIAGPFLALHDLDVAKIVLRERFDVLWVHGYNFLTHVVAVIAQKALRQGLVFREEQTLLDPRPWHRAQARRAVLRALFHGGVAVFIGTENRRWLIRNGFREDQLFFAPYCVDNEWLRSEAAEFVADKANARKEQGIADDHGPVVLSVSRLIEKKQPLGLLEVFRRVRKRQRCTLLVVGSGEFEPAMREKVRADGIPDVVFAGFLNQRELPRAYACADVFVLLSKRRETWGLVVNEALNFSLPILASDKVGCATDLVGDGQSGFVVPHNDLDLASVRLDRLVSDAPLRRAMGERGRDLVDGWNYERAAQGVLEAAHAAAR